MGYMVGYEPYSSGYLIWYPGMNCIKKAQDIIFHEDATAPAVPKLYGDDKLEDVSKLNVKGTSILTPPLSHPRPLPTQPCFTIRIPPRPIKQVSHIDQ